MYKLHGLGEVIFYQIPEKLSTSQGALEYGNSFEKVWKSQWKWIGKSGYYRGGWKFWVFIQVLQGHFQELFRHDGQKGCLIFREYSRVDYAIFKPGEKNQEFWWPRI